MNALQRALAAGAALILFALGGVAPAHAQSVPARAQSVPASAATTPAASHTHHGGGTTARCTQATLACATVATPAFDRRGRLWLAALAGGAVLVTVSDDHGRSFAAPTVLDAPGSMLDLGGDARPQIAIDDRGGVAVAWGVFKDQAYDARVMISHSDDGGASFSTPASISADPASQRFPALAFGTDGRLFAAWLDKRTVAAARHPGSVSPGAALAIAWSGDRGAHFDAEQIARDRTCECCRLAVALDLHGRPAVLLRAIFAGGERDHLLLRWGAGGAPRATRVAADHWAIAACPHHGPALALQGDDVVHAAWYTEGSARQGLFYARSTDGGASFGEPMPVGSRERQAGRPALLVRGDTVWLAWKEFDGRRVTVLARRSDDRGATWGPAHELAATRSAADHPVLVDDGARAWLSWLTRAEGYRLIALP